MAQRKVHAFTVLLVLAVVLFAIFIVYNRRMESTDQGPVVLPMTEAPPVYDSDLGIMWKYYPEVKRFSEAKSALGIRIVTFRSPPSPPPLMVLGVKGGDIILECNGETARTNNLADAVAGLREDGKPVTLLIEREGEKVTLKVDKWPPPGAAGFPGAQREEGLPQPPGR